MLYTATAGEAAPQTVVRAGKRVGYALPVATGTASYAKIHIPINHLVKGSIVVTCMEIPIWIWGSVQANIENLYIQSYGQTASVTSNLRVYSRT